MEARFLLRALVVRPSAAWVLATPTPPYYLHLRRRSPYVGGLLPRLTLILRFFGGMNRRISRLGLQRSPMNRATARSSW